VDPDFYVADYLILDGDQEVVGVDVSVSGGMDPAGNLQEPDPAIEMYVFDIDTKEPTVVSAYAVPDPAKAGPVTVTVEFSEAMDTGVPLLVEVMGLIGPYPPVVGGFTDADTWEGTFDLFDMDEWTPAFISVIGGQDLAGNMMDPAPTAGSFQVDTVEPTLVTIDVSDYMITEADVGGTFYVWAWFSEPMDTSVEPIFGFDPDVSATLSYVGSFWDGGGGNTYVAEYTPLGTSKSQTQPPWWMSSTSTPKHRRSPSPSPTRSTWPTNSMSPSSSRAMKMGRTATSSATAF